MFDSEALPESFKLSGKLATESNYFYFYNFRKLLISVSDTLFPFLTQK